MCCAHELRRRPPTDASRAGRNRAARHRPSHASSKLTPTRSTSRFLDRLRRSKTDGSCRLHGHQTIRRDAQGRLEPRLPDAPLGDILGCVKTDAEAVDLTLFSTASGGRFSSPADDSYRAGFLPPPRLPGFPTQPPGLVPPSPRVFLFQTNARQAPRFAWRGAVIPARSSAARLTHPRLTSRTSTTVCFFGLLFLFWLRSSGALPVAQQHSHLRSCGIACLIDQCYTRSLKKWTTTPHAARNHCSGTARCASRGFK